MATTFYDSNRKGHTIKLQGKNAARVIGEEAGVDLLNLTDEGEAKKFGHVTTRRKILARLLKVEPKEIDDVALERGTRAILTELGVNYGREGRRKLKAITPERSDVAAEEPAKAKKEGA